MDKSEIIHFKIIKLPLQNIIPSFFEGIFILIKNNSFEFYRPTINRTYCESNS